MYDIKELYDDFYDITESSVLYTEANEDLNKQRRAKIVLAIAVLTSTIIAIGLIIRKIKKSMVKNAEEETKKLEAVKEEAENIKNKLKEYETKLKKKPKKNDGTDNDSAFLTDKEWEDANNLCNKSKELNKKIRSLQEKLGIELEEDETEKLDKLQDDLLDRWRNEKKKYWKKDEAHFQDALERKKQKDKDEVASVKSYSKGIKIAEKREKQHNDDLINAAGGKKKKPILDRLFGKGGKFHGLANINSSGENEEDLMFLSLHPNAYLTEMTDDDINESIHVWMEFFNTIETDIELYNESQYNKYDRISSIILEKADHNKISIEKCAELLDSLEKRYL